MKNNIGIICDLDYDRHPLFKSYFHAISNIFHTPKIIKNIDDLKGITTLFIGDDHYLPHKLILQSDGFIDYCNINNIRVIVFTNEKILNSFFPWNVDNYVVLQKIKNLHHFTSDIEDCSKLWTLVNRMSLSKSLLPDVSGIEKKNKMVFLGNTKCKSYAERKQVLAELQQFIDIDIIESSIPNWEEYMRTIAGYRFVFSPIGNANIFTMRFYEILAVGSIPVHQVKQKTLDYYDIESKFEDCIFFNNVKEIPSKIENMLCKKSSNMFWMEDNIKLLLTNSGIL